MAGLDPNHDAKRQSLRSLGIALVAVGGILVAVGFIDFFSAFGGMRFGPPRFFWCPFLGLPMLAIGGNLLRFGYMGAATRYMAGEIAPVAKDTINYMGEETKDTIAGIAQAVIGASGAAKAIRCARCGAENPPDAVYCGSCGESLSRAVRCAKCGEENAPGTKFCHHCGQPLT